MTRKEIYESTDYGQFKMLEFNREVNRANVEIIKASIQHKNKLDVNLLIVTPDMYIVDGQHRFTAAMELELPVYYIIDENWTEEDIALLNTNRSNWHLSDYIKVYTLKDNVEYLYLKNLMEFAAPFSKTITHLLVPIKVLGEVDVGDRINRAIKEGTFRVPDKQTPLEFIKDSFPRIKEINDRIHHHNKKLGLHMFFTTGYLVALAHCFKHMTETQYKELWACIERDWIKFPATSNLSQIKDLFDASYNWGKRVNKFNFNVIKENRRKKGDI